MSRPSLWPRPQSHLATLTTPRRHFAATPLSLGHAPSLVLATPPVRRPRLLPSPRAAIPMPRPSLWPRPQSRLATPTTLSRHSAATPLFSATPPSSFWPRPQSVGHAYCPHPEPPFRCHAPHYWPRPPFWQRSLATPTLLSSLRIGSIWSHPPVGHAPLFWATATAPRPLALATPPFTPGHAHRAQPESAV